MDSNAEEDGAPVGVVGAVIEETEEEQDAEEDVEEETEEKSSGSNTFLVVILVILIVALLLTSGFIFWKYYLPNHGSNADEPAGTVVAEVVESVPETTEERIACSGLSLVSGMETLTYKGQMWLLHIKAVPEDTTDAISFYSEDESVATVNSEGRVTAVGEGETRIVILCGEQKIECPVAIQFVEETTAPTETVPAETSAETAATEESAVPEETTAPTETTAPAATETTAPAVVLKLKKTDIQFGRRGVYTTLQLDCDLTADQVSWASQNSQIASVNAKGEVTAVAPGLTIVTATYGDQVVKCIVRCYF